MAAQSLLLAVSLSCHDMVAEAEASSISRVRAL